VRRRLDLAAERGWALLTTILVMAILMSIALPLMTMVDTQSQGTATERKSEGSFNVAEASLNSMVFLLSSAWPSSSASAFPSACTQSSTGTTCPDSGSLARTYQGPDFSSLAWSVRVRDDTGSEYYDRTAVLGRPSWDANGNGRLWVSAEGRAAGRSRSVVALVRMNEQAESFPRRTITAGWFRTTNNGNKVIVDTRGIYAEPAALAVRCPDQASSSCLGYSRSKGQVSPDVVEVGIDGDTTVPPAVLEGMRAKAQSLGTYYASGCPSSPSGELVFIENGNCSYGGGGQANSFLHMGTLVVARGTVSFGGNFEYWGMVYAANLQQSTGAVISLGGTSAIFGSVAADFGGGVLAGASGTNIVFCEHAFEEIASRRSVGIVQGSWRELPAS
jgi:Tfp pilus assembly protein PilX